MGIVRRLLEGKVTVHAARREAVLYGAGAVLQSKRLSLTAIGRGANCQTSTKHSIKRIDRLLGNRRLHGELVELYCALAQELLKGRSHPVIIVDWTDLCDGRQQALRAAVPVGGRAIPIYAEVHPEQRVGNDQVHRAFLARLAQTLPAGTCPTIVTDSGFKTPWFIAVAVHGWNYVGRVRNNAKVWHTEQWRPAVSWLGADATARPRDRGVLAFTKTHRFEHRCIVVRKRNRGRHGRLDKRTRTHQIDDDTSRRHRKASLEPWILVTSLRQSSARRIVGLYSTRMQIEETFRDEKNHRFGWSLRHARSECSNRLSTLLLLAALASLAVTLLGLIAEQHGLHRRYQANTVTKRRVLSWFVLGSNLLGRGEDRLFTLKHFAEGYETLADIVVCSE